MTDMVVIKVFVLPPMFEEFCELHDEAVRTAMARANPKRAQMNVCVSCWDRVKDAVPE